jgi:antitoxin component YwqK of YwqJK toxin-antitoxin module
MIEKKKTNMKPKTQNINSVKIIFLGICIFIILPFHSISQRRNTIDTICIHDVILSEGKINGKKTFLVNEKTKDSVTYYKLLNEINSNPIKKCRPCYLIELDGENKKIKEGLFYLNTPIGIYVQYHENGKFKESGWYKNTKPLSDPVFKMGVPCDGSCTVKDSTWKYYSSNGKLLRTEKYEMGKLKKK